MVIAILAGGQSARMGRDKAALRSRGETWLERLVREALATGETVIVVGRGAGADWPYQGVALFEDDEPGQGPLGGLVTALRRSNDDVLLCACDMPFVDEPVLSWLLAVAADHPDRAAVAAERGGRAEPLFAVYRREALEVAAARLGRGERAMHRLLTALDAERVVAPATVAHKLDNINDPDALRHAGLDAER